MLIAAANHAALGCGSVVDFYVDGHLKVAGTSRLIQGALNCDLRADGINGHQAVNKMNVPVCSYRACVGETEGNK